MNQDEEVGQGGRAGLPGLVQLNQLQPRRRLGGEAVELEGEIHSLWPRRWLVVLGHPGSNDSSE